MPIKGWDHLELYVGNAKQAAYFYERALGFTHTAYAGPETGVRDRASYVLDQNGIRLVVTSGLRPDSEINRFACSHGDGVKDVALTVPSATEAPSCLARTPSGAIRSIGPERRQRHESDDATDNRKPQHVYQNAAPSVRLRRQRTFLAGLHSLNCRRPVR